MIDNPFQNIELRVRQKRFDSWEEFLREAPEYSIALEVLDDIPGHRGHYVNFDHHVGVVREATMSAAMQAYIAVRQGHLMQRWLQKRRPVPVYVWNADQDVCLAAFVLEYHQLLERAEGMPMLRWIVQYNNKLDVCGGLYPVNLEDLVNNHFTWVFEPYRQQRIHGKVQGDEALVVTTIRLVCDRLLALLNGQAGIAPITAQPDILYQSPYNYVIADEKGDPLSRLVLASAGYTNLISLICRRPNGRYTYSIIRGSPYDEDIFEIPRLIEAFQAAEDYPNEKIWGGSNLAAGSDSVLGSSLHWTQIREIADRVVGEAHRRTSTPPLSYEAHFDRAPLVLLAVSPETEMQLRPLLAQCGARIHAVSSCQQARTALALNPDVDVIFSNLRFSDGCFADLARQTGSDGHAAAPTVVCIDAVDAGCADLLEMGAYTVLSPPFTLEQIRWVLGECTKPRAAAPAAS
ncbi:MAG: hypothetical protein NZR01_02560 [Bryobacteraceae bacterium]|nr:hypothetical protein [Bryobacteraceae bacterium]